MKWCRQLALAALIAALAVSPAIAQGTSSIRGVVTDSSGGVLPGVTVTVTGDAGATFTAVTNSEGAFNVPGLSAGTFKVSVTLQGFKTAVLDKVQVVVGAPTNLPIKLELGALTEEVKVSSSSELINTQTATVTATLNADQLNRMPTVSRNALNAVTFLPGVNTATTNRNSTVNGLPQSMINITLDGVSNQDNFNKSTDGFFASVYPRQDAVEQVTVTLAAGEVTGGGSGAVNIAFTTRSGTNRLSGSAYEYFRTTGLNTNYYFNEANGLPRNETKVNQYGVRVGGPIRIPGAFDLSGKAFYFFHYEELRFPNSFTRTRTVHPDEVMTGVFPYMVGGVVQRVNVLSLGASNPGNVCGAAGCFASPDPEVLKLLGLISASTKTQGVFNATGNPLVQNYVWQSPGTLLERQPTGRVDYNITAKHRLSASASSLWAYRDPDYLNGADARFPGAPNYRVFASTRPLYSFSLRSTLSANMVNEVSAGITAVGGGGSRFGQPSDPSQGAGSFADIGGYAVVIPITTDWWTVNTPSWRAAPSTNVGTNLSWQKAKHSLSFGGGWFRSSAWEMAQQIVTQIGLGMNTTTPDPALGLFTTGNFPGASNADLANARAVYAMLTGRITSVNNQAALDAKTGQYALNGARRREGFLDIWSAFAQDQWRIRPTLTISAGVRWDLQTPFRAKNDTMTAVAFDSVCGQSGRGAATTPYNKCAFYEYKNTGVVPEFIRLTSGSNGYNTDWNNVAPSVSVAWRPNVQSGFLRTILGDPEQATLRAGFSQTYSRQGIGFFTGLYGGNPGSTITVNRNVNNGNLVNAGETWPLLYRDKSRLYPATFPATQVLPTPVLANRANNLNAFAEDVQIDSARTWSASFQRAISRDMAVDIRYVGTRGVDQWSTLDYNARDIEANGFVSEFKNAVANLRAHVLAGCGTTGQPACSFAYRGPGTGTTPLPIYMAYLLGRTDASNAASYTGTNWTNTAITSDMAYLNPSLGNGIADLDGTASFRANAIAAGLPANFVVLNPAVGSNNVTDSGAFSNYHALQIELRRRLSRGMSASGSYQYAREGGSAFDGFLHGRTMIPSANVRHAIKAQWDWTLPVGRGQRYGTDMNAWMDGLLGGWSFKGVSRIQARVLNFGQVRLINMTAKDLQKMYKYYTVEGTVAPFKTVYMLPEDVRLNTRRAFDVSSTTVSGYGLALGPPDPNGRYIAPANSETCLTVVAGDCTNRTLLIRAPFFVRFDVGLSKRFALRGASSIEVSFELLNMLDNINFNPVANPGTSADIFRVTSAYTDSSNTYDPGGRLGQLMFRINW